MCLDVVDKEPIVKEGIGWKVFEKRNDKICNWYWGASYYKFEIEKWNKDSKTDRLEDSDGFSYLTGFHLLKTRESARILKYRLLDEYSTYIIKKVKFRNVTATGTSEGLKSIVAREILILPDKV